MNGYDPSNMIEAETYSQRMAYMYMDNADKMKYGLLMMGLQTQMSLGNNQYPHTIVEANNVLCNHHSVNTNKIKHQGIERENNTETFNEECPDISFAKIEGRYYCCVKVGHKLSSCRWRDKTKTD